MRESLRSVGGQLCLVTCLLVGAQACIGADGEEQGDPGVAEPDSGLDKAVVANGLNAAYFNNMDFTSKVLSRVDPTVGFDWGTGSPSSAIGSNTFSVQWSGFVKAKYSETYTFYVSSDDAARLWVNEKGLVNNWTSHSYSEDKGTIALQAGKTYRIALDYYENTGSAAVQLRWSSASQGKQIIPQAQLFVSDPGGTTNDQCPSDPNKTAPGKCGCGVAETQCTVTPGTCAQGCSAPTPICGADSKCTSTRWVEPISTLPEKWKSKLDTKVWTKWVRSVIPVVGQALTQNAALLEVAYFAERIHMPQGQILVPDLVNSMLGAHPTRFSVYPACPNAWMHPGVTPNQSSGGGGTDDTLVTEDWVLRYPKCTGANAVACNQMKPGTLCNNCGWADSSAGASCRDTLAHEHGHTIDGHRRDYIDSGIAAIDKQVFPYNPVEGPAWSASQYFMNPGLESNVGRDRGQPMASAELNYWSVTQKFAMSKFPAGYGYALKTTRCPQMGMTQACPDTLTRTYAVPLDSSGGGSTNTCVDTNTNCAAWAGAGECTKNPNYMLTGCCASCKR